jgi:alpha-tubulin suppressor-like RCC1 family protein
MLSDVAEISAGNTITCAIIASTRALRCFGANYYGQLGFGASNSPQLQPGPDVVGFGSNTRSVQTSMGGDHVCAINSVKGYMACFGFNTYGELGDGSNSVYKSPAVNVTSLGFSPDAMGIGSLHSCAMANSSPVQIKCFGYNHNGQLGDGSPTNRNTPVSVIFP